MSEIVLLDSAPLGMLSNPKSTPENDDCRAWLARLLARGVKVGLPEIADYEVRRELLRADKTARMARLDSLKQALTTFQFPLPSCSWPHSFGPAPGSAASNPPTIRPSMETC